MGCVFSQRLLCKRQQEPIQNGFLLCLTTRTPDLTQELAPADEKPKHFVFPMFEKTSPMLKASQNKKKTHFGPLGPLIP